MLYENGIKINQKPFAIGARIEHPQILINESQYKEFYNHPRSVSYTHLSDGNSNV